MKKLTLLFSIFLVVTAMLADSAWASDRTLGRTRQPGGIYKPNGTPVSTLININNLAGWVRNDGWSARIPSSGNSGVFFPRGTAAAIFQDGIVWGGNVNDGGSQVLRVGGQTYSIGTIGGRIISPGVATQPEDPDVRIYRIRRDYATADLRQDAAELFEKGLNAVTDGDVAAVRAQYETDWNEWPISQGAPYNDLDSNGVYTAEDDEPGIADADQVIWFVCNDLNSGRTNALYGSNPIGIELQVTLWGYNRTDPLANVYFKKFTFIYKGTATTPTNATITDMYVGQWSDPDMGDAGDDFSGCDTTLSLGYVYNGSATDNEYAKFGLAPPAVGYDFLQGPIVPGAPGDSAVFGLKRVYGKRNLPMTAAFYFAAGGTYSDPPFTRDGSVQWYNLLRGLTPISGTDFVHPDFPGQPTKFWLDGDPVAGTGRIDGAVDQPGDRRLGVCAGPFTMAFGDTQEVVVGVVAGIGSNFLSSITVMKNNDIAVQNAYNDLFDLPKAPPAPVITTFPDNNSIVLNWGTSEVDVKATEEFDRKGYTFQGYNVYQVASPATNIPLASDKRELASRTDVKLLATYDVIDAIRTIVDNTFDPGLGIIVQIVRQIGTDTGIRRVLEITRDQIRNAPLVNGQRYYFAVTAFGYNPSDQALTHALESTPGILTVIPQSVNPGVRYSSSYGDTVSVSHSAGSSDGDVVVTVTDPAKTTGHNYQVGFRIDTVSGDISWFLSDATTSTSILENQMNQSGDDAYLTAHGLLVKTQGPPVAVNTYTFVPSADRWFTGYSGLGGEAFFGGLTIGPNFFGSNIQPGQYVTVEVRFTTNVADGQRAYRYLRGGSPNYGYTNYELQNFTVWDVTSNPPRQLAAAYVEQNGIPAANSLWQPTDNPGDREYLFILNSDYTPTPDPYYTDPGRNFLGNADEFPTLYAMWPLQRGTRPYNPQDGQVFTIIPNFANTPADQFTFTAPAAASFSAGTAADDVTKINVFPNPYYGFNRAETSRFARFVTFNHMPAKAEVRIFNLAGALVKAISKDDPTQFLNWDLTNHGGLPVASGIYIAYMTLKDAAGAELGKKTLKLIVIQEQQYLDNF